MVAFQLDFVPTDCSLRLTETVVPFHPASALAEQEDFMPAHNEERRLFAELRDLQLLLYLALGGFGHAREERD